MVEDKLTAKQRLRLEALALAVVANQSVFNDDGKTGKIVEDAEKFVQFLLKGYVS